MDYLTNHKGYKKCIKIISKISCSFFYVIFLTSIQCCCHFLQKHQNESREPPYVHSMPSSDNKLMEKINYMIHLLEEQRMDKTANITEEFILYILLKLSQ